MLARKVRIIEDFLGSYYKSRDEFLFFCPKCKHHNPKLSVNFDKDVFKCWVCDYNSRTIKSLIYSYGKSKHLTQWKDLEGIVDFSEIEKVKEEHLVCLPEEFITLTGKNSTPLSIEARKYLKHRGLTRDNIVWWKIGFCSDGPFVGRIIIPSFDLNGNVNYFIARSYNGNWQKYYNPPAKKDFIFNELYLDWDKSITIVEGVFDAIVADNAVPLLGSTLREDSYIFQKIIANCKQVYIALDSDAQAKEDKITRLLLEYGVVVHRIDTSGFGDIGEMDKEAFQTRKKTSTTFHSLDDYLLKKLLF
jgi:DNA primase